MESFAFFPKAVRQWLYYEQCVNERMAHPKASVRISDWAVPIPKKYWPEQRAVWELEALLVPRHLTRGCGDYRKVLREVLAFKIPRAQDIIFIHPQAQGLYRGLIKRYGLKKTGLLVTPTSSYRTLLAWNPARPARTLMIKLSLDARIASINRVVWEQKVVGAYLATLLLGSIDEATRRHHHFDYLPELGGSVHRQLSFGFAVRTLWRGCQSKTVTSSPIPLFSLYSQPPEGDRAPLLVSLIRHSRLSPRDFVTEYIITPYVRACAYLLFEEGLLISGHVQNVLFELEQEQALTGRLFFRDFGDATLHFGLRLARRKTLPVPVSKFHRHLPLPLACYAEGIGRFPDRGRFPHWCQQNLQSHGVYGVVWLLHRCLKPFFPTLKFTALKQAYWQLWQEETCKRLGVKPLLSRGLAYLAVNEAIDYFLAHTDWDQWPQRRQRPPAHAFTLPLTGRSARSFRKQARPHNSDRYLHSAWGDLLLRRHRPLAFLAYNRRGRAR